MKEKIYFCGKHFITSPIEKLYPQDDLLFGLSIIHGEDTYIYTFTRVDYNLVSKYEVDMPNRHNRGGQSQNRHQRNNDIIVGVYINNTVNLMKKAYLNDSNVPIVKGILIVGTGEKRMKVQEKLPPILQKLVHSNETIPSKHTSIEEILESKAHTFIDNVLLEKEMDVFNEFLGYFESHIQEQFYKAVYGTKDVTKAFLGATLQKLIIIDTKNSEKIKLKSKEVGCEIYEISGKTIIGSRLLKDFGGVVGIKWY